ncbi:VOC family protein [Persicobacter diffluens]|uniref:VOC domain-containing protein n=1 Tax=Persicobacter diffluens TaxID=981 RepID=A0AAN4VWL4_9BACT|nr:hypothetical protein PEDI_16100 [Persicobacter diffluens]
MQIHRLKLFCSELPAQLSFYEHMGFELRREGSLMEMKAGWTQLIFQEQVGAPYYHFAFLIPRGRIQAALEFVKQKGIGLLPFEASEIIEFTNGRAIYFYDPAGNIVEFIERPGFAASVKGAFSLTEVLGVNEVGLPSEDPLALAQYLQTTFGIKPIAPESFRPNFCWVGDHQGVMICVKAGRNWLPTTKPSVVNDLELEWIDSGGRFLAKVRNGVFEEIKKIP